MPRTLLNDITSFDLRKNFLVYCWNLQMIILIHFSFQHLKVHHLLMFFSFWNNLKRNYKHRVCNFASRTMLDWVANKMSVNMSIRWFSKCGPWPWMPLRVKKTKALFVCFSVLTFALMARKQWWVKLREP